jgi:hypothetical protein
VKCLVPPHHERKHTYIPAEYCLTVFFQYVFLEYIIVGITFFNLVFFQLTDDVARKKTEYQKYLELYKLMRSRFEEHYVKCK